MFKKVKQLNKFYEEPKVVFGLSYYAYGDVDRCEEDISMSVSQALEAVTLSHDAFVTLIRILGSDFRDENDAFNLKIETLKLYEGSDVFKIKPEQNSVWFARQPAFRF